MARIMIAGSADGLGQLAARQLIDQGHQVVLQATSDDPAATVTGGYFYHQRQRDAHPAAGDRSVQDALLSACARLTGVPLPPA